MWVLASVSSNDQRLYLFHFFRTNYNMAVNTKRLEICTCSRCSKMTCTDPRSGKLVSGAMAQRTTIKSHKTYDRMHVLETKVISETDQISDAIFQATLLSSDNTSHRMEHGLFQDTPDEEERVATQRISYAIRILTLMH